jgi:cytochrome c553
LIAACLILLGARDVVAGDDEGVQIAATCSSCHGQAEGKQAIPTVAGLDEQTIVRAMKAFRASEEPSHVMHAVALSLTDEELASVAHYLATHGDKASSP